MQPRSTQFPVSPSGPSPWLQVILPIVTVMAASLIVTGLRLAYPSSGRFLVVYAVPVAVSAFWAGRTGGLVATLLTVIAATYVTLPPEFRLAVSPNALPSVVVFAAVCVAIAYSTGYLGWLATERERLYVAERARARQQAGVSEISRMALAGSDLTELMDEVVRLSSAVLDTEYAKILELLPGGDALILRSGVGWREGLVGHSIVPARNSQAGYALAQRRPVVVSDLRTETRFSGPALLLEHGVVSGMSVIIERAEKPYGVFGVHTRRLRWFTDDDVNFLQAVANVLGVSLQRRATQVALAQSEERLRIAVEAGQLGTWDWDLRTNDVMWSPKLEEIHGIEAGSFAGTFEEFQRDIHPEDRDRVLRSISEAVETGAPYVMEYRIVTPGGARRWLAAQGEVLRDSEGRALRMIGVCRDATLQKDAEAEREHLLAQERRARAEAEDARDRLAFLADVGKVLASMLDYEQTLSNVAGVAVPRFADWCAVDLLDDEGVLQTVALRHSDPEKVALALELQRRIPRDPEATSGPAGVVRTGQPELYEEISDELISGALPDPGVREAVMALRLRSVIIAPLTARGRTLGTFTFATAESGRSYGPADLALASELTHRAALFVDNARLYNREHRIAATLQRAFLPAALPALIGIQLDAAYLPAAAEADLGGDWYDAFRLRDGRVVISLGDVAGHGLEAGVTMGLIRQAIRATAYEGDRPDAILARAGRLLDLAEEGGMATAIVGVLDPTTMTLTYAGAGHPAPLLASPNGEVKRLPVAGMPLGVRGASSVTHEIQLPPGGLLVFYTDGLIEFERRPVEGEAALVETVRTVLGQGAPHPARRVLDRTLAGAAAHDDIAVLTVAVEPRPLAGFDVTYPAIPSALPLIRQAIEQLATASGLEPERIPMLQIAVGEAVNNAIEHAYGLTPGTVRVRARVDDTGLVTEVHDSGRWRQPRLDRGGRGLRVMQALVDDVAIERTDGGTIVRLRLSQPAPTGGHGR